MASQTDRRREGRWKTGFGVGIFLVVLGAIMAFAMEATTPGINVNTLGIILLIIGLVVVLYSLLFGSNLTPWSRRRIVVRRRTVVEERPVEVVEEDPLDEGLP
jgi:membrane-bound ClpP family serine protease